MGRKYIMKNKLLEEIYQKYYQEIYLYLYSLSHNKTLVEDLVQETFLKALLSLNDEHPNVRAWLYTVARNLYLNEKRYLDKNTDVDECQELASEDKQIIEQIIGIEKQKLLYEALLHIEKRQREVITLNYFGKMKQKEISSLLKISPENVRILSHRAKQNIRKYMEDKGYEL